MPETDTIRKIRDDSNARWLEIKRDVGGAVSFTNIGSQSTSVVGGNTKTLTTKTPDRALGQKLILKVGAGFTTFSYTLKVNGATLTSGTGTGVTVTTSQLSDLVSPTLTAVAKAVAGTGTVTFTAQREERWI